MKKSVGTILSGLIIFILIVIMVFFSSNKLIIKENSILAKAKSLVYDKDGTCKTDGSTYKYMNGCYIKGNIEENYVWFNGFIWRIMGINSDKTVRLIANENITSLAYGEEKTAKDYTTNKGYINDWLNEYFYDNLNSSKNIIKEGKYFCSEPTSNARKREDCSEENKVNAKIGTISIDEYLLAGEYNNNYLEINQDSWTMTPSGGDFSVWYIRYDFGNSISFANSISLANSESIFGVRPIVNVKGTATITSGIGNKLNFYVLEEDKSSAASGNLSENVTSGEYIKIEGHNYRVIKKTTDGIQIFLDGYYKENGKDFEMQFGEENEFTADYAIYQKLNTDVLSWLNLSSSDKLVETIYYSGERLNKNLTYYNTLNKTNGIISKIGLIQIGEILSGQSSTLLTNNFTENSTYKCTNSYWTISKSNSVGIYSIDSFGYVRSSNSDTRTNGIRPVITIKNNLKIISGNGTWINPYLVENS